MEQTVQESDKEFLRLVPSFLWAARTMGDLPPMNVTEVAFAGRSNVGKSSLVNAMLNRKGMARASSCLLYTSRCV